MSPNLPRIALCVNVNPPSSMAAYVRNLVSGMAPLLGGRLVLDEIRLPSIPYLEDLRRAVGLPVREGYVTDWFLSRYLRYPARVRQLSHDVIHLTDDAMAHLLRALDREHTVISCFDLRPLKDCAGDGFGLRWHRRFLPEIKRAARVIAPSEATGQDLTNLLGVPQERIRVIPLGVEPCFRVIEHPLQLDAVRAKYELGWHRWALHVGTSWPHKNIENIIRALQIVSLRGHRIRLLKVGDPLTQSQWALANDLGVSDRIRSLPRVSEEDLVCLYNLSSMVLLPSLSEGFGFPILEAFACGVPVLTSNVLSMPEVGGDAAWYVDPTKPEGIAEKMIAMDQNHELVAQSKARGLKRAHLFSWESTAARTLATYEELLNHVRTRCESCS